jgi:hypothetical protein
MGSDVLRRLLGSGGFGLFLLGAAVPAGILPGCASQQTTAQALTVVGAAAVMVGASLASDDQCYDGGSGSEGPMVYCSPSLSRSGRKVATGVAAAGVGLAAAGYALTPKGPDQFHRPPAAPVPGSQYRLIRATPEEGTPAGQAGAPGTAEPAGASPTRQCEPAGQPPLQSATGEPACSDPGRGAPAEPGAVKAQPAAR